MTREELCDAIQAEAERIAANILTRWREVGVDEPWLQLPAQMGFDHLPAVLRMVAEAALRQELDRDASRDAVVEAAKHGETRMKEGFPESYIYTEYLLLRRSLWAFVQKQVDPKLATRAIMQVDSLLGLMTLASLRGYHRPTFEDKGEWPDTLDRMFEEWPLAEPHDS